MGITRGAEELAVVKPTASIQSEAKEIGGLKVGGLQVVPGSLRVVPKAGQTQQMPVATREATTDLGTVTTYVPWGSRAQIELERTKIGTSEKPGEVAIYQKATGLHAKYFPGTYYLVSGGGRGAAQSGAFTINAPQTPLVYKQESKAKPGFAPSANVTEALKVLAAPKAYSRLGAETYGGFVMPLDERTVQSTGARYSTFINRNNLANYVNPQGVNLRKSEAPGAKIPWEVPASTPAIFQMNERGIVRGGLPTDGIVKITKTVAGKATTTPSTTAPNIYDVYATRMGEYETLSRQYEAGGRTDVGTYNRLVGMEKELRVLSFGRFGAQATAKDVQRLREESLPRPFVSTVVPKGEKGLLDQAAGFYTGIESAASQKVRGFLPAAPERGQAFRIIGIASVPQLVASDIAVKGISRVTGKEVKLPTVGYGEFIKGEYTGIREKPVTAAVSYGAGLLTGGVFGLSERGAAAAATRIGTSRPVIAETIKRTPQFIGTGLGVFYAGDVITRTEGQPERLGQITSTEVLPFMGGMTTYAYRRELASGAIKGAKWMVTQEPIRLPRGYEPAITINAGPQLIGEKLPIRKEPLQLTGTVEYIPIRTKADLLKSASSAPTITPYGTYAKVYQRPITFQGIEEGVIKFGPGGSPYAPKGYQSKALMQMYGAMKVDWRAPPYAGRKMALPTAKGTIDVPYGQPGALWTKKFQTEGFTVETTTRSLTGYDFGKRIGIETETSALKTYGISTAPEFSTRVVGAKGKAVKTLSGEMTVIPTVDISPRLGYGGKPVQLLEKPIPVAMQARPTKAPAITDYKAFVSTEIPTAVETGIRTAPLTVREFTGMQDLAPTLAQRDIGGRPSERAFWYGLKEKQPKPQRGTFDYEFKGTDIGKFRVYGGGIPTGILAGVPRKETGIEKGPGTTTTQVRIPGITEIVTPTTIQPPIELQTPTTDITQLFRFSMDNRQVQRSFQQTKNYYTWTTPTYLFSEGPKFGRGVAAPIPYGGGGGGGGYKRKRLWYEQFNVGLDIGFFGNINRLPARSTARKTKKKTSKKRR